MLRILFAILMAFAVTACATTGSAVEKEYVTVKETVRAPCPDDETFEAVIAARPVPLRQQAAPVSEDERIARERRQLGLYEAPGLFADQAVAVIESCHSRQALDPPP